MNLKSIKILLDKKVDEYHQPFFIEQDPISIPHLFTKKQDIEIAGFFAAIFSWGNRKTIIYKSKELLNRLDMQPHEFVLHHSAKDLKQLLGFKHRTFNEDDLLYFIHFLHKHYSKNKSLETAFSINAKDKNVENGLKYFCNYFFEEEHLVRTEKHISTPAKNSACKRLNMFLRWMVRSNTNKVDFGIWKQIKTQQLIIPLDVHVLRVSDKLGLLINAKANWKTAVELTEILKTFDNNDPVKYDFALFGMGVMENKTF